jgi:8-oxo-dGTP pyrophosphatase MutT (NUDIX family)
MSLTGRYDDRADASTTDTVSVMVTYSRWFRTTVRIHYTIMRNDNWTLGPGARPPVTSIGMIPFSVDASGTLSLLMVCRKTSVGFMDFVRGKYSITNLHRLHAIIDTMTLQEKDAVLHKSYDELWIMAWGKSHARTSYRLETDQSSMSFDTLKRGISVDGDMITLHTLIQSSTTRWDEPEWEFPKGRKNFQEKDIDCAYREVSEETGLPVKDLTLVENILPFEETFIGSNFKTYKYKYFLASVPTTDGDMTHFQQSEISAARWFTCSDALKAVRPYHAEKMNIITSVKSVLESLRLFYTS